jgi:hypothetical protein
VPKPPPKLPPAADDAAQAAITASEGVGGATMADQVAAASVTDFMRLQQLSLGNRPIDPTEKGPLGGL